MLSHDNLTWAGKMVEYHFEDRRETDALVSYLPLSHIAAQVGPCVRLCVGRGVVGCVLCYWSHARMLAYHTFNPPVNPTPHDR